MKSNFTHETLKQLVITVFVLGFSITSLASNANKVVVVPLIDTQLPAIQLSKIVELVAPVNQTIIPVDLRRVAANGDSLGAYVVPGNQVLVVTSITFLPNLGSGTNSIGLIQGNNIRRTWSVPNSEITQLHFSPGMLIDSGQSVRARGSTQNGSRVGLVLRGYEVKK